MRSLRLGLLVLVGVLALAGCGGGDQTSTEPAKPLPAYLATFPTQNPLAVYYLQWQQRGDDVDGGMTIAVAGPETLREPVKGSIDEEEIDLEVGQDAPQEWKGTRHGRSIDFKAELADGSTQTLRFTPATLAEYKRAVAKLG